MVCNPVYTAYHTRPSKERLSVLDVLRNGRERIFRLNAEALGYMENLKWSKMVWRTLQSWVAEAGQDLEEPAFLKRLEAVARTGQATAQIADRCGGGGGLPCRNRFPGGAGPGV